MNASVDQPETAPARRRAAPGGSRERSRWRDEGGSFTLVSIIALGVVLLATGTAAALLARTMNEAVSINDKAAAISEAGQGINTATDAVIQLNRTNETAGSILSTAEPLEGQLSEIVALAKDIDKLGKSINGTAGTINETAGQINNTAGTIGSTAGGINSEAAEILDVAERIDFDVAQINKNLDTTIGIAERILGDTGNIITQARNAHTNACNIDAKLNGEQSSDGHC